MILVRILPTAVGLFLLTTLTVGAVPGPVYQAPQAYYLALGDSIAFGYQPTKGGLPPSRFDTGYVDVFAGDLRRLAPRIQVVNYACSGESTKTFLDGGCPGRGAGLHDPYQGTQLKAAIAFLRAHPGRVGPITLTLWGNDLHTDFAPACQGDLACIRLRGSRGLASFEWRLGSIMGGLRAAAPRAEIILTGAWNYDIWHFAKSDPLFRSIDRAIARVARAHRARVARIYRVLSPGSPANARACALTFVCSNGDVHPTDAGYRAMAAALLAASGYPHRP